MINNQTQLKAQERPKADTLSYKLEVIANNLRNIGITSKKIYDVLFDTEVTKKEEDIIPNHMNPSIKSTLEEFIDLTESIDILLEKISNELR